MGLFSPSKLRHQRNQKRPYTIKEAARDKAQREIDIPFGQLCEVCHKIYAFERHHKNYKKALDVMFVCRNCHRKLHKSVRHYNRNIYKL